MCVCVCVCVCGGGGSLVQAWGRKGQPTLASATQSPNSPLQHTALQFYCSSSSFKGKCMPAGFLVPVCSVLWCVGWVVMCMCL